MLVVDDDEDTRSLIVEILKGADFEVWEATDGLDGLEKISGICNSAIAVEQNRRVESEDKCGTMPFPTKHDVQLIMCEESRRECVI